MAAATAMPKQKGRSALQKAQSLYLIHSSNKDNSTPAAHCLQDTMPNAVFYALKSSYTWCNIIHRTMNTISITFGPRCNMLIAQPVQNTHP